jgi:hypothetical protein
VGGEDGRNGDRTLAALSLMTGAGAESPMIEAAIADAARMARSDEIARRAAPWRRPRGLGVATRSAAVMVVASWWPAARPSAAPAVAVKRPGPRGERLDPRLLVAERTTAGHRRRAGGGGEGRRAGPGWRASSSASSTGWPRASWTGPTPSSGWPGWRRRRSGPRRRAGEREDAAGCRRGAGAREADPGPGRGHARAEERREQEGGRGPGRQGQQDVEPRPRPPLGVAGQGGERRGARQRAGTRRGGTAVGLGGQPRRAPVRRGSAERNRRLKRLERDLSDGADQCRENPEACRQALEAAGRRSSPT